MQEKMGTKERQAIYEAVKIALYWWSRMYRKGSMMTDIDLTEIPSEMYSQFSAQEIYELDFIAEELMQSLDKISFDEVNRLIDLTEYKYTAPDTESEEEQS